MELCTERGGSDDGRGDGLRGFWTLADASTAKVIEHNDSWPSTHTYLGYVPATGTGFVLLVDGNDLAGESRLLTVDRNVWNILLGQPIGPAEGSEEFLLR